MIVLDLSILNQKGTPMFNSDTFANRPAFGIVGRIFISTDTKEFFRDTGTSWELIGGPGSGTITGSGTVGTLPIWTTSSALGDSTLLEGATKFTTTKDFQADGYYLTGMTGGSGALYWTSNRVTLANYNAGGIVHIEVNGGTASTIFGTDLSLTNNGYISAVPTLTAASNASSVAIIGVNTLSYAASFSANNIGAIYGAITGFNLQTFAGNATFANSNVASGGSSVNSIDFSTGGSTITMTQSSGIRVMSGQQNLFQYQGSNSGTITHAAISQNTGFYRPTTATGILTITNAYSHLINALDDYGAGFTFTNRWGIYQAGASDLNYFAANMLLGSTTNNGNRLQVTGNGYFSGNVGLGVTLNTWSSDNAMQIGDLSLFGYSTGFEIYNNAYYNTQPTYKTTAVAGSYQIQGNEHRWKIAPSGTAGNAITFTQAMTLTSGGNVLIGTTTDIGQRLQVSGGYIVQVDSGVRTFLGYDGTGSLIGTTTNHYLRFITNDTERIRITSGGNLLVGTTTDGGAKLQVNGTAYISGITNIGATAGGSHQLSVNVNGGADREMFICGVLAVSNGFRVRFDNATTTVRVTMSSLPTSPVGLSSGDLWNNVGILNIV